MARGNFPQRHHMDMVNINRIVLGEQKQALFHVSGALLFDRGHLVSKEDIGLLRNAGIRQLATQSGGEDRQTLVFRCQFRQSPLTALRRGMPTPRGVYDRSGKLLLSAGVEVTPSIVHKLKERGINNIYIKRNAEELHTNTLTLFQEAKRQYLHDSAISSIDITLPDNLLMDTSLLTRNRLDDMLMGKPLNVTKNLSPIRKELIGTDALRGRANSLKDSFLRFHEKILDDVRDIFEQIQRNRNIPPKVVSEVVGRLMGALIRDREMLLNLTHASVQDNDYILHHAINVTTLAINIGTIMDYDQAQLYELAHGAFLYDIGMLKVPHEIVFKQGKLTSNERGFIERHPYYSVDFLQRIRKLPATTAFVAYQAHERPDGSGYPTKRTFRTMHEFAKIVSIADIYDALTSDRPFREHLSPYRAMEGVLKMAARRKLDNVIVRSFLEAVSLFPVGSLVMLSDQSIAKVVGCSKEMTKPVVSVIYLDGKTIDPPERIDLSEDGAPNIARSLDHTTHSQSELMKGF